jgi:hypothetical protein
MIMSLAGRGLGRGHVRMVIDDEMWTRLEIASKTKRASAVMEALPLTEKEY